MTRRLWLVLALIIGTRLTWAVAAQPTQTFGSLRAGDVLELNYQSVGCFHHVTYELTFQRGTNLSVGIVEANPVWSDALKKVTHTNRVALGQLTLNQEDVAGLDRLLQFYRGGPYRGCTTVDHITLTPVRDGKRSAPETFTDGSCSEDHGKGLHIRTLIGRLKKEP